MQLVLKNPGILTLSKYMGMYPTLYRDQQGKEKAATRQERSMACFWLEAAARFFCAFLALAQHSELAIAMNSLSIIMALRDHSHFARQGLWWSKPRVS